MTWTRSLIVLGALLCACSSSSSTTTPPPATTPVDDAAEREKAVNAMHDALLADVTALEKATEKIQAAAPSATDRGWDATADAAAITSMQNAWFEARTAYEHVEGALASLFPDIDLAIDARYDDFLSNLASQGGDAYLFDDKGVIGMHAVERILYAHQIPQHVVDFEKVLPGYVAAEWPKTGAESADFKAKLCAKLVSDTKLLLSQWTPAHIDVAIAYQGLTSLMTEQREKVNKAASSEEESRYSQRTMSDLRDNLAGTKVAYGAFQHWILAKDGGKDIDTQIQAGFGSLDVAYGRIDGAAIPQPPPTWSAEAPSAADLQTPFGQLYTSVHTAVDPNLKSSIVAQLDVAGTLLGFRKLAQK